VGTPPEVDSESDLFTGDWLGVRLYNAISI